MREAVGGVPDDQGTGGAAVLSIAGQTEYLCEVGQATAGIGGTGVLADWQEEHAGHGSALLPQVGDVRIHQRAKPHPGQGKVILHQYHRPLPYCDPASGTA